MTIQDLGNIGEFLAAIATLVTLIYLAQQIRQNTKAIRSASHHAITDSFNQLNGIVAADPAVGEYMRKGSRDYSSLTQGEEQSFRHLWLAYFRIFETLYYQYQNGTMDKQLYESEHRSLESVIANPGVQEWWKTNTISFSEEFRNHVDGLIQAHRTRT